ncbi:Uncharacterized protein YjbI, contains pentapeptide repeats [Eubacterium ruminantium]|nr:Uncharacterized protein YjbI, contains pentapeptide repeats [Eubacterium ruminantium]
MAYYKELKAYSSLTSKIQKLNDYLGRKSLTFLDENTELIFTLTSLKSMLDKYYTKLLQEDLDFEYLGKPSNTAKYPVLHSYDVREIKKMYEDARKAIKTVKENFEKNKSISKKSYKIFDEITGILNDDMKIVNSLDPRDNLSLPTSVYKVSREIQKADYVDGKLKDPGFYEYSRIFLGTKKSSKEILDRYINSSPEEVLSEYHKAVQKYPRLHEYISGRNSIPAEIRNTGNPETIENYIAENNANLSYDQKVHLRKHKDATMKSDNIKTLIMQAEEDKINRISEEADVTEEIDILGSRPKVTVKGAENVEIDISQPEKQTSGCGCWSCAAQMFIASRGIDNVTQEDIRNYRPNLTKEEKILNDDEDDSRYNYDEEKNLFEMGDSVLAFAPNSMMHQMDITPYTRAEESKGISGASYVTNTVNLLKKQIIHAIKVDHSPVALLQPGHYITIVGIDGDKIKFKNSRTKEDYAANYTFEASLTDFVKSQFLDKPENARKAIQITWMSDIKLSKDGKKIHGVPSEYAEMNPDGTVKLPPPEIQTLLADVDMVKTNRKGNIIARSCGDEASHYTKFYDKQYTDGGIQKIEKVYIPKQLDAKFLKAMAENRKPEEENRLNDIDKNFYGLTGVRKPIPKDNIYTQTQISVAGQKPLDNINAQIVNNDLNNTQINSDNNNLNNTQTSGGNNNLNNTQINGANNNLNNTQINGENNNLNNTQIPKAENNAGRDKKKRKSKDDISVGTDSGRTLKNLIRNQAAKNSNNRNQQNAIIQGTNIQNNNIQGVNTQNTNIQGANTQNTNIQGTNVQNTNPQNTNVQQVKITKREAIKNKFSLKDIKNTSSSMLKEMNGVSHFFLTGTTPEFSDLKEYLNTINRYAEKGWNYASKKKGEFEWKDFETLLTTINKAANSAGKYLNTKYKSIAADPARKNADKKSYYEQPRIKAVLSVYEKLLEMKTAINAAYYGNGNTVLEAEERENLIEQYREALVSDKRNIRKQQDKTFRNRAVFPEGSEEVLRLTEEAFRKVPDNTGSYKDFVVVEDSFKAIGSNNPLDRLSDKDFIAISYAASTMENVYDKFDDTYYDELSRNLSSKAVRYEGHKMDCIKATFGLLENPENYAAGIEEARNSATEAMRQYGRGNKKPLANIIKAGITNLVNDTKCGMSGMDPSMQLYHSEMCQRMAGMLDRDESLMKEAIAAGLKPEDLQYIKCMEIEGGYAALWNKWSIEAVSGKQELKDHVKEEIYTDMIMHTMFRESREGDIFEREYSTDYKNEKFVITSRYLKEKERIKDSYHAETNRIYGNDPEYMAIANDYNEKLSNVKKLRNFTNRANAREELEKEYNEKMEAFTDKMTKDFEEYRAHLEEKHGEKLREANGQFVIANGRSFTPEEKVDKIFEFEEQYLAEANPENAELQNQDRLKYQKYKDFYSKANEFLTMNDKSVYDYKTVQKTEKMELDNLKYKYPTSDPATEKFAKPGYEEKMRKKIKGYIKEKNLLSLNPAEFYDAICMQNGDNGRKISISSELRNIDTKKALGKELELDTAVSIESAKDIVKVSEEKKKKEDVNKQKKVVTKKAKVK